MAIVMDLEEDKASVQEEIIEELLKHGADVDILSRREYQARGVVYESPLHVIARRGKPRILNQLLRYTSNINKTNNICTFIAREGAFHLFRRISVCVCVV